MISAKNPRVTVTGPNPVTGRWLAACLVPECGWTYGNVIKSDVTDHAAHHRALHRAAVVA